MVTSAFVGAGIVALGAANMPDHKQVDAMVLADLENAAVTANDIEDRSAEAERASRDSERGTGNDTLAAADAEADYWSLPLEEYRFTSPYAVRWGKLHAGIDLAAAEGTPYKAMHGGVVKQAGYAGGYGYSVTIQHPDGTETVYAHSRKVLVQVGQQVKTGDVIGEVGNTGYSYGTHLHLEMHVGGKTVDPIPELRKHGVDIKLQIQSVYGGDLGAS